MRGGAGGFMPAPLCERCSARSPTSPHCTSLSLSRSALCCAYQAVYPVKLEVYSGSDDSNCPLLGTMTWAYGLGLPSRSAWSPWYYDDAFYGDQFAGFQVGKPCALHHAPCAMRHALCARGCKEVAGGMRQGSV